MSITFYTGSFPEMDPQIYEDIARGPGDVNVHIGNLNLGSGNWVLGDVYITGYLKIQEAATVQLDGIVYVAGGTLIGGRGIHIEHGATINGSGTTDTTALIAENGDIKIELCTFDVSPIPMIWAVNGTIERIEQNQIITALFYAPSGHVKFEENVQIYGAVFAQTMDNVENCTITIPNSDESGFLVEGPTIHTWEIYS